MPFRLMLDTNAESDPLTRRSSPSFEARLGEVPARDICVSAVAYGETKYGLARVPEATRLAAVADRLFLEFHVAPWTMKTADVYGALRAEMRRLGKALGPLDMMIAAHAIDLGVTLVTADKAFRNVPGLVTEDWSYPNR